MTTSVEPNCCCYLAQGITAVCISLCDITEGSFPDLCVQTQTISVYFIQYLFLFIFLFHSEKKHSARHYEVSPYINWPVVVFAQNFRPIFKLPWNTVFSKALHSGAAQFQNWSSSANTLDQRHFWFKADVIPLLPNSESQATLLICNDNEQVSVIQEKPSPWRHQRLLFGPKQDSHNNWFVRIYPPLPPTDRDFINQSNQSKRVAGSRRITGTPEHGCEFDRVRSCPGSARAQQEQVAAKQPNTAAAGITKPGATWSRRAGGVGFAQSLPTHCRRVLPQRAKSSECDWRNFGKT